MNVKFGFMAINIMSLSITSALLSDRTGIFNLFWASDAISGLISDPLIKVFLLP